MKAFSLIGLGIGAFAIVFAGVTAGIEFENRRAKSVAVNLTTPAPGAMIAASEVASSSMDFRAPAKRALASSVSIATFARTVDFFNQASMDPVAQGSGVFIDKSGYIITNNHVVRLGESNDVADQVVVTLSNGKSYDAKIIGTDPRADLAVLKVDGIDVTPIEIGDSSSLEVGQAVLAVGNPLGYSNSVTHGIVSSLGRDLNNGSGLFVDGIQTDASINSGNSGGPLVDANARLIGINSSIAVASQFSHGSIGIGFAIPVNRVKQVFQDIRQYGHARYGELGIQPVRFDSALKVEQNRDFIRRRTGAEPPTEGLLVAAVQPGTSGGSAGIRPLDVILEIDGKKATGVRDYLVDISNRRPGDKITIKLWSAGQIKTVTVTLGEAAL